MLRLPIDFSVCSVIIRRLTIQPPLSVVISPKDFRVCSVVGLRSNACHGNNSTLTSGSILTIYRCAHIISLHKLVSEWRGKPKTYHLGLTHVLPRDRVLPLTTRDLFATRVPPTWPGQWTLGGLQNLGVWPILANRVPRLEATFPGVRMWGFPGGTFFHEGGPFPVCRV